MQLDCKSETQTQMYNLNASSRTKKKKRERVRDSSTDVPDMWAQYNELVGATGSMSSLLDQGACFIWNSQDYRSCYIIQEHYPLHIYIWETLKDQSSIIILLLLLRRVASVIPANNDIELLLIVE